MNKKKIEEILELMEKHGLNEIDIEEEGVRIHLKKGHGGVVERIKEEVVLSKAASGAPTTAPETKRAAKNLIEIKSPMVGTFYKSPSPDAPSYVEVGSSIKEGDVLCVIEAMKLMNEIKAEVNGKIADVLVENGEPIEFGQVLFLVEQ
ncbi:MAG: acetyl-CoA carboxylase biotin carboxyl carrier protein [Candidatus Omnitrophica bacterium]|nr:acetyl-CoA carboxylase biotin carboxyl carrier protein [Candidatus Omnitrophota bacterium]